MNSETDFAKDGTSHMTLYSSNQSPKEVQEVYNNWRDYDEYCDAEYNAPAYAAKTVYNYFKGKTGISILDVGAGTGLVGKQLQKLGFSNVAGLEGARKMFEMAKSVYTEKYSFYIGPESKKTLQNDMFDCVVTAGVFIPSHLAPIHLNELIRITKQDGLIITVLRTSYLESDFYRGKLIPYMNELEQNGNWKQVEKTDISDYHCDCPGMIFVHRVLVNGFTEFESAVLE